MEIVACRVLGCGKPVAVKKSQLCRSHYNRWNVYGDFELSVSPALCRGCGVRPPRAHVGRGTVPSYCSKECRYDSQYAVRALSGALEKASEKQRMKPKAQTVRVSECVSCLAKFEGPRARRFCSISCENKFYRNENFWRPCILDECERPAVAKELCVRHYKRWCRAAGLIKPDAWDHRRRANWEKREALKRGAGVSERLVAAEVFERDDWVCGICDGRIDSAVSYPDSLSASLDHVIPLSRGGEHTLSNVQAAHLVCNIRKGNRLEEARG